MTLLAINVWRSRQNRKNSLHNFGTVIMRIIYGFTRISLESLGTDCSRFTQNHWGEDGL